MEALDGQEGMLIHGEAMIEITHYQRVDQLEFGQQQGQQPQGMHGA